MNLKVCLPACLCAAALHAAPIKHEFIAIDEGKTNLLYVNENDPAKNWIVPIGKSHPRDMQLVGGNRILIGNVTGYSEFDIATGNRLVDVTNFASASAKTDTDKRGPFALPIWGTKPPAPGWACAPSCSLTFQGKPRPQ